jgi:hypothetical protein
MRVSVSYLTFIASASVHARNVETVALRGNIPELAEVELTDTTALLADQDALPVADVVPSSSDAVVVVENAVAQDPMVSTLALNMLRDNCNGIIPISDQFEINVHEMEIENLITAFKGNVMYRREWYPLCTELGGLINMDYAEHPELFVQNRAEVRRIIKNSTWVLRARRILYFFPETFSEGISAVGQAGRR